MYNYILHPTNLRNRDLELEMRIEEGARGYGIYIMILELMRDADNYRLKNRPKSIGFAINEADADTVARIINNYGLFEMEDDVYFFSPWLRASLAEMDAKKAALSAAGKRGAAARAKSEHAEPVMRLATPKPALSQAEATRSHPEATPKQSSSNKPINEINESTNKSTERKFECDGGIYVSYDVIDMICRQKGVEFPAGPISVNVPIDSKEHNTSYIERICRENDIPFPVFNLLLRITNYGEVGGRRMMQLIKIIKKCRESEFKPLYWGNYIIKKMEES